MLFLEEDKKFKVKPLLVHTNDQSPILQPRGWQAFLTFVEKRLFSQLHPILTLFFLKIMNRYSTCIAPADDRGVTEGSTLPLTYLLSWARRYSARPSGVLRCCLCQTDPH